MINKNINEICLPLHVMGYSCKALVVWLEQPGTELVASVVPPEYDLTTIGVLRHSYVN